MANNLDPEDCKLLRTLIERKYEGEKLRTGQELQIAEHVSQCKPCAHWEMQTRQIVSFTQALPEFDVPEALTQQIIAAAQTFDAKSKSLSVSSPPLLLIAAISGTLILAATSFDNADSWGSWAVCFGVMFVIKQLLSAQKTQTKQLRHG